MIPIYLGRLSLLAALYVLTGKLGLMLAVPPGYATIVWPASGIALGMLITQGARLWPGVLVGSCFLNAWNSGALDDGDAQKWIAALLIAAGSTAQALAGRELVTRYLGTPLRLQSPRQVAGALLLAGPVACTVAATAGVGTLFALDIVPATSFAGNWVAWWSGDTLGVLLFAPLVILAPGQPDQIRWRGARIGRIPLAALLLLLLPLGLTFYAWKAVTENDYQRGSAKFETLTTESEKALQNRLTSYGNAVLGGAGFVQGSTQVSRAQWHAYVETIKVRENFPGMNGIGWIEPVEDADLQAFVTDARADDAADFSIHPQADGAPHYIIKYIEPEPDNRAAIGLNIAFEKNRRQAAELARDSGHAAITGRITLVQDARRLPGFLMLYPIYRSGAPTRTVDERRAALRGWSYAPIISNNFLDDLTQAQNSEFRLTIFDGIDARDSALIFSSLPRSESSAAFTRRSIFSIQQRRWLLVWESTPSFERSARSSNPLFILIGGLLFTALLGLLLLVVTVRRTESIENIVGERRFAVPLLVFAVIASGGFALHSMLIDKEHQFITKAVEDQSSETAARISIRFTDRMRSLSRMASRWEAQSGTPFDEWRKDASNYVTQLPGLRSLQWLDAGGIVRWVEPLAGNEQASGLDARNDPMRRPTIEAVESSGDAAVTPPLQLPHGSSGFVAYLPVRNRGNPDGFIAGAFETEGFFDGALQTERADSFVATLLYDGHEYFNNAIVGEPLAQDWSIERPMRLGEREWKLRMTPTATFIDSQLSALPSLVFAAVLMVAALAALSVRFALISRLKSAHLAKSSALNAGIISSTAHLVIALDAQYRVVIFNRAAENALGYRAAEVLGRRAIPTFMERSELEDRARTLSTELGEPISVGPAIFTRIPLRDGHETREWTFVRKNGTRFPVSATITPLRDSEQTVTGFLGVIEDVTTRREVDRIKSEFTAVVSHELRTPLTSIRGSLGLILGTLAASLPAKVRSLLEIAHSNCERLVLLVNDILDVEKFSAGQMRFEIQPIPLAEVLGQSIAAIEPFARKYEARIELAPVDPDWTIAADSDRFIQVMTNLLSNASKYSPSGGVVSVWAERRGDAVRILVRDQGPGIPESFQARLFGKFSQADSSATREKGGTGLGLHISKKFVEHMHGSIGFESIPGEGATFWVEMPLEATVDSLQRAAGARPGS